MSTLAPKTEGKVNMTDDHSGPSVSDFQHFEMLTLRDFSKRIGIGRTKIFEMKSNGILIKGRHYFQNGRKVLFPWGVQFIERFLAECCENEEVSPREVVEAIKEPPQTLTKRGQKRHHKTAMDARYCIYD